MDVVTTVSGDAIYNQTVAAAPTVATTLDLGAAFCEIHISTPLANTGNVVFSFNGTAATATNGFTMYPGRDHYFVTQHPIRTLSVLASAASQGYTLAAV